MLLLRGNDYSKRANPWYIIKPEKELQDLDDAYKKGLLREEYKEARKNLRIVGA